MASLPDDYQTDTSRHRLSITDIMQHSWDVYTERNADDTLEHGALVQTIEDNGFSTNSGSLRESTRLLPRVVKMPINGSAALRSHTVKTEEDGQQSCKMEDLRYLFSDKERI